MYPCRHGSRRRGGRSVDEAADVALHVPATPTAETARTKGRRGGSLGCEVAAGPQASDPAQPVHLDVGLKRHCGRLLHRAFRLLVGSASKTWVAALGKNPKSLAAPCAQLGLPMTRERLTRRRRQRSTQRLKNPKPRAADVIQVAGMWLPEEPVRVFRKGFGHCQCSVGRACVHVSVVGFVSAKSTLRAWQHGLS